MSKWSETIERYIAEGRTVSGGKGEGVAQQQMKEQNALQREAFNMQKARLDQLSAGFGKYIDQNIGYDPAQLAMLQSQFLDQNANNFNQAGSNVRAALAARGAPGAAPPGGSDTRGLVGLEAARAGSQSQGMLGIGISNLQQALNNRFNAGSIMSGNAATLNSPISSFGSGASNALGQYMQATNSGFGATFMRALGGGLGAGLAGGITGGIGGMVGAPSGSGFGSGFGTGFKNGVGG